MATLLINKAKVSSLLQVAIGIEETEFNKYIEEAQKFDLKPLVCEDFYFELIKNKDTEPWKKLLEGGDYTYEGKDYEFDGIGSVLAYFSYARFFLSSPAVSTSHGIVTKTNPYSTPVELQERKNVYYKKKEEANELMKDVIKFIERNISNYTSWKCESSCGSSSRGSFNSRVIQ